MKKLIAFSLVACVLAISAIGCGTDTSKSSTSKSGAATTGKDK